MYFYYNFHGDPIDLIFSTSMSLSLTSYGLSDVLRWSDIVGINIADLSDDWLVCPASVDWANMGGQAQSYLVTTSAVPVH